MDTKLCIGKQLEALRIASGLLQGKKCNVLYLSLWIRATWYSYESNQQDATLQVNLLFPVSSTCFGRCFRLSSGALDCIYSIW